MKRNGKMVLCLLLAALLLTACAPKPSPEDFPDLTQAIGPTATPTRPAPTDTPVPDLEDLSGQLGGDPSIFAANPYDVDLSGLSDADILGEENKMDPNEGSFVMYAAYSPDTTVFPYAGATPIPLDPVDKPTPTPRPSLSFTYSTYTASTVGVSFDAPVGWTVDQSIPSMLILSEPELQMKDGQQCVVTVTAEPVSGNYSQRDLETYVGQRLDTLYSSDYTHWKPSYTATRHMMGATGVYANYSATTSSGVEVGGRIHYVCIDNTLYGLEILYPLGFRGDFIDGVFSKIRSTMTRI